MEQPDIVQSIKESDIIEDDHHNVEDVYNSDVQLYDDEEDNTDHDDYT